MGKAANKYSPTYWDKAEDAEFRYRAEQAAKCSLAAEELIPLIDAACRNGYHLGWVIHRYLKRYGKTPTPDELEEALYPLKCSTRKLCRRSERV